VATHAQTDRARQGSAVAADGAGLAGDGSARLSGGTIMVLRGLKLSGFLKEFLGEA